MKDLIVNLPFPPTINSYYVSKGRGKFISKNGRIFREKVSEECLEQSIYGARLELKLKVEVVLYPPDNRVRDLDNYMKALLDALTHAKVWSDDSLIDELIVYRGIKVKGGLVKVRISEHHGFICPNIEGIWEALEE